MEGGEVELRRGHQHDEATHQLLGAQHQHRPSLGGVLVASILPSRQPRLGNWPSRALPGESLHALSVVGVDPRVGVQREALSHRHPPVLRQRSDLGEGHALLHPLMLKGFQAVFGTRRLIVLEERPSKIFCPLDDWSGTRVSLSPPWLAVHFEESACSVGESSYPHRQPSQGLLQLLKAIGK
jgi:hypothetical protein